MADLPPWPAQCATPGTEQWAVYMLRALNPGDARAITDLVARALVPYPSLWRARTDYARVCHERHWSGEFARAAWAIMEALLRQPEDDSIPF